MNPIISLLKYCFLFMLFVSVSFANEVRVMSYNIRCGYCENPSDINNWSQRKFLVAEIIRNENPDIIGLQEAEQFQIKDLASMLGNYAWVGVGREDGREGGEATAILYRKDRFNLQDQRTLWLSETPEIISKGWDAFCTRTVTILRLADKSNGREFYMFNTHLDHIGIQARIKGSSLLLKLKESTLQPLPFILTGDFNFTRDFEGYKILVSKLFDTQFISSSTPLGGDQTFNEFGKDKNSHNKIDFIFVDRSWRALGHSINTRLFDGKYPSDHFPVTARLELL